MNRLSNQRGGPAAVQRAALPMGAVLVALALALALLLAAAGEARSEEARADAAPVAGLPSPLAPAATSSPRQTFQSFRTLVQGATGAFVEAFALSAQNDALFDTPAMGALKRQAIDQLVRAATTLDLSQVAPANRRTVGTTSVLLLEEILVRIPLPPLEEIPDEAAVDAGAAPNGWTIPGTEIRMTRLEAPDGEPRFLFSADTVARLPEFYARVEALPRNAERQTDYYQRIVVAPGLELPVTFYRAVLGFPDWARAVWHEQAVWQWIALGVLTALVLGGIVLLLRWESRRALSLSPVRRSIGRLFAPVLALVALQVYEGIAVDFINISGDFLADLELVIEGLEAIALAVLAVLAFNLLAAVVIASPRISRESLDASLIRLVMRVVGIAVAGYIVFLGATEVGIPVYGIIAGLGVGGLAIALAVRPTLENFIGGIILYADRPVKVGDFCKFGEMLGTVETIGLRSTKIRGLDRTLVTVQNADFAQMSIVNFTRRDANLMHTTIALRYETTPEQLTAIIDGIADMLRADDRVDAETVRVCFRGFGSYSLDVEIWAYVKIADWGRFLKAQEALFLEVIRVVKANGSAFAFPSQTTYLGRDETPPRPGADGETAGRADPRAEHAARAG